MKFSEHTRGRWPEIISAILGPEYANTKKHQACPKGFGKDGYRFSDKAKNGNYFCHCSKGEKDGVELIQCVKGWDFKTTAEEIEKVIGECPRDEQPKQESWAKRLRREVIKTKRSAYLESRGLSIAPVLDWHKALPYFDENGEKIGTYQAMLAPVMRDGRFLTYHVTYLEGGSKASVPTPRKLLPGATSGGSVPLYPAAKTLGIAEGIETAIAAKTLHGVPTWAALNTALLQNWKPPQGVEEVWIFADHDTNLAGHAAAYQLAHKLICQKFTVHLRFPEEPDTDWNDVLLQQRKTA